MGMVEDGRGGQSTGGEDRGLAGGVLGAKHGKGGSRKALGRV